MKFVIVRHGQSEDNIQRIISGHNSTPLTKLGREQAKDLSQQLLQLGIKFDSVYSSDLKRAAETAEIVCKELGIKEINFDKRLRETDAGLFTNRHVESLSNEEKAFIDSLMAEHIDISTPEGESNIEHTLRTKDIFYEIVNKHPEDSTILLIGHGGTLFHILIRVLNVLTSNLENWFVNCAINILERNSQNTPWKITMLNNEKV